MKDMTHEQMLAYVEAVKELEDWAAAYGDRDALIRKAHDAGLSNSEIAKRMKISRTTVIQVLGTDDESED